MKDQSNGYNPGRSVEVSDALVDAAHDLDNVTDMIRRAVGQCSALLRQDLERKVKQEPLIYKQDHTDSVIRQFEAASEDIEATIINRVRSKILSHIHDEIRRVLEDAVNDGVESLEDPLWKGNSNGMPPINGEAPGRSVEPEPVIEEDDATVSLGTAVEESDGASGTLPVHPDQQSDAPPTPPIVQERNGTAEVPEMTPGTSQSSQQEGQNVSPSLEAKGTSKEPSPDSADEVYEGTVKLNVVAIEGARQVVHFVEELRKKPDFQLLQLVGNHKEGVGVWLGLRAPLRLKEVLRQMEGVSQVEVSSALKSNGHEPLFKVQLAKFISPN